MKQIISDLFCITDRGFSIKVSRLHPRKDKKIYNFFYFQMYKIRDHSLESNKNKHFTHADKEIMEGQHNKHKLNKHKTRPKKCRDTVPYTLCL